MADDSGEDLVSNVKVTGVDEATAQLEAYGDKGAAAFDKVNAAAAGSAAVVDKSSKRIQQGAQQSSNALGQMGTAVKPGGPSEKALNALSREASDLSRSIVKTSRDLAQFATRVAALATIGAAAIAGIAKLGVSIAQQLGQTTSAFDQNNQAQQRVVAQNLSATQAAIQYSNQQQQLNRQLANGTIDYDTYSKTLKANQQAYKDQIRVTAQLQAAEEDARIETERLQKAAADRKAYDDLVATFGGPLTSSLLQLGNAVLATKNQFIQAFGPGASAFVDTLTQALNANGSAIANFFSQASDKIQAFVSQNGPAIQQALESIGTAAAAVFNGLITAAPKLLSIFNNQVVPAFRALSSMVDSLTTGFNAMFGTNLTSGALVVIGIIANLTGGVKTLLAVFGVAVQTFTLVSRTLGLLGLAITPIQVAVLALAAGFILLNADWTAFGQNLLAIWASIQTAFSNAVEVLTTPFKAAWQIIQDGWDAVAKSVVDRWNAVIAFFTNLPDVIGTIFASVGGAITGAFTSAFDAITSVVKGWVDKAKALLQPIVDLINSIGTALGSGGDNAANDNAPAFAGGGGVRGPGTSTSDSILAWLSNNEFVMRAKAVRKYGLAFMRAVNSGSLDLSGISRFAAGGLASIAPRLLPGTGAIEPAMAGRSGNWGTLNLQIGDQVFENLGIPDRETADSLTRYVVQRGLTSGGRKPSWKGN